MPMGRLPWAFVTNTNLAPRILLSNWNHYDSAVVIINDSALECLFYPSLVETYSERSSTGPRTHPLWRSQQILLCQKQEVVWVHWSDLCFIRRSLHLLRSVGMSFSAPWGVAVHHHRPQNTAEYCSIQGSWWSVVHQDPWILMDSWLTHWPPFHS